MLTILHFGYKGYRHATKHSRRVATLSASTPIALSFTASKISENGTNWKQRTFKVDAAKQQVWYFLSEEDSRAAKPARGLINVVNVTEDLKGVHLTDKSGRVYHLKDFEKSEDKAELVALFSAMNVTPAVTVRSVKKDLIAPDTPQTAVKTLGRSRTDSATAA